MLVIHDASVLLRLLTVITIYVLSVVAIQNDNFQRRGIFGLG